MEAGAALAARRAGGKNGKSRARAPSAHLERAAASAGGDRAGDAGVAVGDENVPTSLLKPRRWAALRRVKQRERGSHRTIMPTRASMKYSPSSNSEVMHAICHGGKPVAGND